MSAGSSWTLTDTGDTVETYTASSSSKGALLDTITARGGYAQKITRNESGQVTTVTDSYGRELGFTYTANGSIESVKTPEGTSLNYAYAAPLTLGDANLVSVAYPTSTASVVTYGYTNPNHPNVLATVTDENNNSYLTFGNVSDQVYLAYAGTGTAAVGLAFSGTTSSVTANSLGVIDTYGFTTLQGAPKVSSINRAATTTTAPASRSYTYDKNGYVASATDWNGNKTTYTNNNHGDPVTITQAVGTPQARTTTIAYDPVWVRLPDTTTTQGLTEAFTYNADGNPDADTHRHDDGYGSLFNSGTKTQVDLHLGQFLTSLY